MKGGLKLLPLKGPLFELSLLEFLPLQADSYGSTRRALL